MVAFINVRPVAYSRYSDLYGTLYLTENRCLINNNASFTLSPDNPGYDLITAGSNYLYDALQDEGVFTELYIDCQAQHGLRNPGPDGFYGTGITTTPGTNIYIAKRVATFFQAMLNSQTTGLGATKFVDCENTRYGCGGSANNSCTNIQDCD